MICVVKNLNSKTLQFVFFSNQKKGRKKSTPKPMLTNSFSPDGAIITRFISNRGTFSFMNFFMYLESAKGIVSANF